VTCSAAEKREEATSGGNCSCIDCWGRSTFLEVKQALEVAFYPRNIMRTACKDEVTQQCVDSQKSRR
jgi:hypothetical protein